jgi:hypothetical protein
MNDLLQCIKNNNMDGFLARFFKNHVYILGMNTLFACTDYWHETNYSLEQNRIQPWTYSLYEQKSHVEPKKTTWRLT